MCHKLWSGTWGAPQPGLPLPFWCQLLIFLNLQKSRFTSWPHHLCFPPPSLPAWNLFFAQPNPILGQIRSHLIEHFPNSPGVKIILTLLVYRNYSYHLYNYSDKHIMLSEPLEWLSLYLQLSLKMWTSMLSKNKTPAPPPWSLGNSRVLIIHI